MADNLSLNTPSFDSLFNSYVSKESIHSQPLKQKSSSSLYKNENPLDSRNISPHDLSKNPVNKLNIKNIFRLISHDPDTDVIYIERVSPKSKHADLEKAEANDEFGIMENRDGKTVFKFSEKVNNLLASTQSIHLVDSDETFSVDDAIFETLSNQELFSLKATIKAYIVFLKTVSVKDDEEGTEKKVKKLEVFYDAVVGEISKRSSVSKEEIKNQSKLIISIQESLDKAARQNSKRQDEIRKEKASQALEESDNRKSQILKAEILKGEISKAELKKSTIRESTVRESINKIASKLTKTKHRAIQSLAKPLSTRNWQIKFRSK